MTRSDGDVDDDDDAEADDDAAGGVMTAVFIMTMAATAKSYRFTFSIGLNVSGILALNGTPVRGS